IGYKKLPWDHQEENLAHELKYAVDAVRRAMDAGYTILVHCQCGVARSATVIIAFVMTTMGLPMSEAYDYVKARAPAISPNLHLLYQLREYEQ
ncbi:dual specificity phosphatase, partial [Radiomyces spectabilis]|uniref:dual specificity phosphatase n=1 Tax=Radiomyces spectabilis TaxID=64574 RepID=UPI00222064EC